MNVGTNSNPYAFPLAFDDSPRADMNVRYGMTLRDYFAAKELGKTDGTAICERAEVYARIADHCYRMADAMLAAREVQS